MAQAFFYYQQKIDPSWYEAGPVAAPDLSWLRQPVSLEPVPMVRGSGRQDPSWFIALAPVDLSWLQVGSLGREPVAGFMSGSTNPATFLATDVPLDLSWVRQHAISVPMPHPLLLSAWSDPSRYLALMQGGMPWLQQYATTVALRQQVESAQTAWSWFRPLAPVDLSWMQTHGVQARAQDVWSSVRSDGGWFVAPAAVTLRGRVIRMQRANQSLQSTLITMRRA